MKKTIVTLAALGLTACGGGSTAELKLMDAPPAGVTSVKLQVASMQVHVDNKDSTKNGDPADSSIDDDDKWESLAVNQQIDLVQHQGEANADPLGKLDLPEGKITQIRLVIDTTKPNTATLNGTECDLDMSKVAQKGIKIDHAFKSIDSKNGSNSELLLDFNLEKSLTSKGTCFQLDPHLELTRVKVDGNDVAVQ
jgi:hypothetical protein